MPLRRFGSAIPLSKELQRVLLFGPESIDKTLHEIPDHDSLVRLWLQHEPALRAQLPRGRRAWMEERIYFVEQIRRGRDVR